MIDTTHLFYYSLATAAVVAATTVVFVAVEVITTAEKDEDKNNYPGATAAKTRITTHKRFLLSIYITYYVREIKVLQIFHNYFIDN